MNKQKEQKEQNQDEFISKILREIDAAINTMQEKKAVLLQEAAILEELRAEKIQQDATDQEWYDNVMAQMPDILAEAEREAELEQADWQRC